MTPTTPEQIADQELRDDIKAAMGAVIKLSGRMRQRMPTHSAYYALNRAWLNLEEAMKQIEATLLPQQE